MAADGPATGNLFVEVPATLAAERFDTLVDRPGARLERIVSTGHATQGAGWYDQDDDEWVAVLAGSAVIEIDGEGEPRRLAPGDWIFLPAHCRHRAAATDAAVPTVWLALHVPAAG